MHYRGCIYWDLGRIMLAVEKYKNPKHPLKGCSIGSVSLSQMIVLLAEYGVESNLEYEDYLRGQKSLRKQWP